MRRSMFMAAGAGSLFLCAASAPAVHALDLTGSWIGKWSCKGFDGAKFKVGNKTSTLHIVQVGDTFIATIDAGNYTYNGATITDSAKPEKGEALLNQCGTDNLPLAGTEESEIIRASVKTKLDSPKASFKALSIYELGSPRETGTCKYSYKREDTAPPTVQTCTPI